MSDLSTSDASIPADTSAPAAPAVPTAPTAKPRGPGYAGAVLVPACLLFVALAALGGSRLAAAPEARPAADALARSAAPPVDVAAGAQALGTLGRLLLGSLHGALPAVLALALVAASFAVGRCMRVARPRRRAASAGPGAASTTVGPTAAATAISAAIDVPVRAAVTGSASTATNGPASGAASGTAPLAASRSADSTRAQLDIALGEVTRLREAATLHEAELRAARDARTRFVARISHALRTPLNGIIGMSEMLASGDLDDERRRCATRLAAAGQNLVGVVNGLLDQARLESGELRLQRSRFALHDAIEDGCQRRGADAHARGVELVCYIDDDVPRTVDGDGNRLWQVIDALVANAIEHTDRGEVVVHVVRDGATGAVGEGDAGTRSRYRCDVQDTGRGLSPESQLELWRTFRTGGEPDAAASGEIGGIGEGDGPGPGGLGLRTANELVRRMHGELDVRSRLGEGSRFSFTFELGDVEQAGPAHAVPRTLRGMRALVVDDNETNRTILAHQLGNWGLHVESADGGPAALEALHAAHLTGRRPDLLVLDLHMPGMDGLELARRIATDPVLCGSPALLLTSSEVDLDAAELDALGIERNLTKPARQSVLHDTLASMLRGAPVRGTGADVGGSSGTALLDVAALEGIRALQREGAPDLLARVVDVWRARAPGLVDEMRAAIDGADPDALVEAVHGLKSSSSYLGATGIAARCRGIETALETPFEQAADELLRLVEALGVECAAVGRALAERTAAAA